MTCPHNHQKWSIDMKSGHCVDCGDPMAPLPVAPLASPSGRYLQHTGSGTNWVLGHELPRVLKAMVSRTMTMAEPETQALIYNHWRCKYLNLRVDMRTAHFIITDQNGARVDGDDEVLQALGLAPLVDSPPQLNG